jgi:hypothetical protein
MDPEIKYDDGPKDSVELLDTGVLLIGEQTWLEVAAPWNCDNDLEVFRVTISEFDLRGPPRRFDQLMIRPDRITIQIPGA